MTKSTITRERLQEIAEDGFLKHGESKELARMALVAMDSEPDRNPVLAYADSYRDMAKQGVESVPIWSVITDLERNIAPLYRHAQPVPVVLDAVDTNLIEALRLVQCMLDDYRERNYGDAQGWIRHINTHMSDYTEAHGDDAYSVLHNLITATPQSPGSEPDTVPGTWIPVNERLPEAGGDMIVFTDGIVMSGVSYAKKKGFYIQALEYDDDEPVDSVTHWMPLPATPQEVK